MRRWIAGLAILSLVFAAGCFPEPASTYRPATAAEMRVVAELAATRAHEIALEAQRTLGPSYEATVTGRVAGPAPPVEDEIDPLVPVVFEITVWPRSSPNSKLTLYQHGETDSLGNGGGSDAAIATLRDLVGLPTEWQPAMVRYLASSDVTSISARPDRLMWLRGIDSADERDDPAISQLLDVVREHARETSECVYLRYRDDGGYAGQIVAYERPADRWVLLASRRGMHPAPFVNAPLSDY